MGRNRTYFLLDSKQLYEELFNSSNVSQNTTRLRRFIADEVGECCDTDVAVRLDDLNTLTETVPEDYESDLTALKTLGNETRYRIVRLLAAAENELCVCEITPLFDVSESAVSHALSDLTDAGLVTRRKEGTWRYYQLTTSAEQLVEALDIARCNTE
jgi:DNA-binding transcriptional ArsR family regulator